MDLCIFCLASCIAIQFSLWLLFLSCQSRFCDMSVKNPMTFIFFFLWARLEQYGSVEKFLQNKNTASCE